MHYLTGTLEDSHIETSHPWSTYGAGGKAGSERLGGASNTPEERGVLTKMWCSLLGLRGDKEKKDLLRGGKHCVVKDLSLKQKKKPGGDFKKGGFFHRQSR